jgi:nitroimidazol reductase NimA-like FMN-containing flavoprotein (pyridoxamine 5'-phosphate oxidase superfamily)
MNPARCSIRRKGSNRVTDQAAIARQIIDDNPYLVLGTADETGSPWATPVYFAHHAYRDFYWVSTPVTRHSRNIAGRPQVSIVVFDSRVAIGDGQAVYMPARAQELQGEELVRGIAIFSRRSVTHGAAEWTVDDVTDPAPFRLFRARASEHSMLAKDGAPDRRVVVDLFAE